MMQFLRYLPPAWAHDLAPLGIQLYAEFFGAPVPKWRPFDWRGLHFRNRLGIAGGVDKNADLLERWPALGAGFAEVGTLTPQAQKENPGKIIDRHWQAQNLWNKMGFPNVGAREAFFRIECADYDYPLFINIGKNRNTPIHEAVSDYTSCVASLEAVADVFVINMSSPNTPGLRDLQNKDAMKQIVSSIKQRTTKPLLVKLSPDLNDQQLQDALESAVNEGASGFTLTNTTTFRPAGCPFPAEGGLSGKDLAPLAKARLQQAIQILGSKRKDLLLVSVGGVLSPADVKERLDLGADLVQAYSALAIHGPRFFHETARYFGEEVSR
jgi:dihydroorotate dehydrogenase